MVGYTSFWKRLWRLAEECLVEDSAAESFKESVETCIYGNMKHLALTGGQQLCKLR